ncbi:short-chain dehydrogenase [Mycolicibacterium agri]|uniref:Short-chain dehydrogenase n=1 Tax=Mycolicibacterium agri TaxID=36811 RepID=A0A2A7NC98_MYCAG|nr:SDR family oxidoreductase [Mycolicibacterium agri]PEG41456.1 short-chain dehydrogenase [Mycolicibacterium agri]GFG53050.1 short-chain dehydrogenase [Mycolicibacterium agri]
MPTAKAVFITGAAAGIGRATALTYAAKGYTVGGYDIDETGLQSLADDVAARGGTPVVSHLDVTDSREMAQRVGEFADAAGNRLDVMINNAGILRAGRFEDIALEAQLAEIDINAKGVVNGLHAAFPYLRSTPGSVAVNLASASAIYGQPELATYSATKFFVRGITEALDLEWSRYGIRVIAIWPLYVNTAMTENVHTGTTESLGIRLTAQDVADAIVAAVDPPLLRRVIHQVHFPVGAQTKASALSARLPLWLQRLLNKHVSGM